VVELPFHHRDPFDRLLAAQASKEGLSMVHTVRLDATIVVAV
jgi:PIN domain nuclease of toxin-antitoxin system